MRTFVKWTVVLSGAGAAVAATVLACRLISEIRYEADINCTGERCILQVPTEETQKICGKVEIRVNGTFAGYQTIRCDLDDPPPQEFIIPSDLQRPNPASYELDHHFVEGGYVTAQRCGGGYYCLEGQFCGKVDGAFEPRCYDLCAEANPCRWGGSCEAFALKNPAQAGTALAGKNAMVNLCLPAS